MLEYDDGCGNVKILAKEQEALWLKTFGLKSIDEYYSPKHSDKIKCALQSKAIQLTKGSLKKLAQKNRLQYILQIKQVLDEPELIIRHDGSLIFAKKINDKIYFTSIGREFEARIVIISNAPKRKNTMIGKLKSGELLYQSPKFEKLRYNQTFTDERSIINEIDKKNATKNNIKSQAKIDKCAQQHNTQQGAVVISNEMENL